MKKLSIDIETYCDEQLPKCGVYKYAQSVYFKILLFGYSIDDGEVKVVDIANGEEIPSEILDALVDENVTKFAFNAQFERVCLSRYLLDKGILLDPFYDKHPLSTHLANYLNPQSWKCTMVWSATLGLPLSLEGVGAVLGLDKQKLSVGKNLISFFCKPCTPTKSNGERTRNLPVHAPEKWELFKQYNIRDVETEMAIQQKISRFPAQQDLWYEYHLCEEINDRGIGIDAQFVEKAIELDEKCKAILVYKMQRLTNLDNPNSVQQIKKWLLENGLEMESLGKKEVAQVLQSAPKELADVLVLRQQISKSSIKKYTAMQNAKCDDNRARGMFQFYGANRTGRFSGRLIQLQNLPQNHISDLAQARELVKSGNYDALTLLYDDIPDILSQLIRTAFVPQNGNKFIVADFSAIEARVISWLSGEKWKSKSFADGEDIYCKTASKMFGIPVEKHRINGHLRQKGKIAELACIAENELVLTNKGLIPIQNVTTNHLLWDGENWVKHQGVIYKGEKEVIEYEGLRATKDHLVWVEGKSEPIQFGIASTSNAHLIQTGVGGKTIKPKLNQCKIRVYDIRNAGKHNRFTVSGKLVHNCGYGGSVGALKAMGALDMGLQEDELQPLVTSWREANPNIVKLWWDVDKAVKDCIKQRLETQTHGIKFMYKSGFLFIELPSGRKLAYVKPRIGQNKFGGESVTYEGIGATKKWERLESYGPKFVENIVQAISRDILLYAMKSIYPSAIVAHVHDELIIECDKRVSLDVIFKQMAKTPPWAKDLLLRADGYECEFYKKD